MRRVADTIALTLAAHGVRHAFGMPGGEVVTLLDALGAAGVRFILVRGESAGAMAAAGLGVLTGTPGLLVRTLGPGLANAVNGIADAAQERAPLIVVTGVVDRPIRARYTHQILDQAALLRPLVKGSFEIEPESAEATVRRAVALATTPPMGPVHLDLAPGIAALPDPAPEHAIAAAPKTALPRPTPDDPALAALRERLAAARRPLIVAGFGAARAGAGEALLALARRAGAPILTTYKAKGLLDEDDPLALGAAGLAPKADAALLPLARAADLVLGVGYDPIEMRPGWLDPFAKDAHVVEIDEAVVDHGMHRVDARIVGAIGPVLEALAAGLAGRTGIDPEVAATKARLRAAFVGPEDGRFGPHAAFRALAEALPREATVSVDSGAHRILLSQMWNAPRPLSLIQSAGWCTMGPALPLAMAARLARPDAPALAVIGDGGLEMTMGELGTLRDERLPVTVVVLQDASLALIALKQAQAGLARAGVGLGATDYAAAARAFGGRGWNVGSAVELRAALDEALAGDTFAVIAARVDEAGYRGAF
ncbi:thiamine pyrophosphate-binding protein [Salinarimonas ramus]|uniref:Acetolactate synthase n=1 Tax=Salinarimonas ramus TaxID=690164 RepID=A0A917QAQ4_9HYPH|nr:thiamine pyrophosphate-binding protein [Salinarimonas ramus]GGK37024.1 acetolactate synthase [Salinarimonas ramus]